MTDFQASDPHASRPPRTIETVRDGSESPGPSEARGNSSDREPPFRRSLPPESEDFDRPSDLSRSGRERLSRDWPAPVPDAPPITFTVKGRGNLPDGEFLIDVYPAWSEERGFYIDGVTLAFRPDRYHGTLWLPPSEGVRST